MPTNEQIKLRANFLNAVASGSIVASVITPAIGLAVGIVEWNSERLTFVVTACAFWFVIAVMLHLLAYRLVEDAE